MLVACGGLPLHDRVLELVAARHCHSNVFGFVLLDHFLAIFPFFCRFMLCNLSNGIFFFLISSCVHRFLFAMVLCSMNLFFNDRKEHIFSGVQGKPKRIDREN